MLAGSSGMNLEASGVQIGHLETVVGADGKEYPARVAATLATGRA